LSVGFVLATALVLLGYGYFDISAMPSLAGPGSLGAAPGWKNASLGCGLGLLRTAGARLHAASPRQSSSSSSPSNPGYL
jgi:hypothetical protein